jgi:hypothetical protein
MRPNNEDQVKEKPAPPLVVREAYSMREGCAKLGISVASGYRRAAEGKLKIIKIGGRSLISANEIARIAANGA